MGEVDTVPRTNEEQDISCACAWTVGGQVKGEHRRSPPNETNKWIAFVPTFDASHRVNVSIERVIGEGQVLLECQVEKG